LFHDRVPCSRAPQVIERGANAIIGHTGGLSIRGTT